MTNAMSLKAFVQIQALQSHFSADFSTWIKGNVLEQFLEQIPPRHHLLMIY